MSLFEYDENLEEILTKAKRIDKGVHHLEKKLSDVKNLGLSCAPEETKNTALNVLQEYEDEVLAMKENCEHCMEEEEKMLKESVQTNEGILNFIANLKNDLDKIEENLRNTGQYQPYEEPLEEKLSQLDIESPIAGSVSHNNSDSVKENSIDELESNNISSTSLTSPIDSIDYTKESMHKTINGKSFDTGSLYGDSNGGFNFNVSASTCLSTPIGNTKSLNKCNDSLNTCYSPFRSTRKATTYEDDACRTPVDPGISLTSMKLLGKSYIKTKVYKTGSIVGNQKIE